MKKKLSAILLLFALLSPSPVLAETAWESYKKQFVTDDGRVVDYYQNNASHSESMGYGMLLSVANNDKAEFKKMEKWFSNNMNNRKDNLIPWLWGKRVNGSWGIIDFNNATDGDTLIALAYLKSFEIWHDKSDLNKGKKIVESMRKLLHVDWKGLSLLMPSYYGYAYENSIIMNPSYFLLEAYRKFSAYDDKKFWNKVYNDSLTLLKKSWFSDYKMPPEWIELTNSGVQIYSKKTTLFHSNAIRVIMNLAISEPSSLPTGVNKILDHYEKLGYIPDWVDLEKNSVSLNHGSPGFYATFALAAKKLGRKELSKKLFKEADKRLKWNKKSYYSFSLYLLSTTERAFY